jgi:hypothetical protein
MLVSIIQIILNRHKILIIVVFIYLSIKRQQYSVVSSRLRGFFTHAGSHYKCNATSLIRNTL